MRTRQLGHETIVATTFSRQATRHNFKNIKKALDVCTKTKSDETGSAHGSGANSEIQGDLCIR